MSISLLNVMNRLNYNQKFTLIGILFLIPIAFMSYSLTSEIQKTIKVGKNEQHGVAYLKPVHQLLIAVQKHRGLANAYLNGDKSQEAELVKLEKEWQQAAQAINEQDALYGAAFGTHSAWSGLETRLSMLQEEYANLSAEDSFDKHTAFIDDLLTFNSAVSDASELTLDPEQHTYYLMDMLVQRLPLLTEMVSRTRGQAMGTLVRGKLTPDEKLDYMITYDHIQSAATSLQKDWTNASVYKEDVAALKEAYTNAAQAVQQYGSLFSAEILSGQLTIDSNDFFAQATAAIDRITAMYTSTSVMMHDQLQQRIDREAGERNRMLVLNGVILLIVVLVFAAFYRNVRGTILVLEKAATKLAEGDASVRAELVTRDELRSVGDAFNRVAEAFARLLRANQTVANQLAAASSDLEAAAGTTTMATNQIALSVQELATMADQQSSISDQNAEAMTEMAEGIATIAESAGSAADKADQAAASSAEGRQAVAETAKLMASIRVKSDETSQALNRLSELSGQIGSIAEVMTEIARQTNLLSLNANIEAARAGEHGKGFSVVAQEVKKLSEQSSHSADEIGALVTEAAQGIRRAVAAMSGSAAETAHGMSSMERLTSVFDGISEAIGQVAVQIGEVSASSMQLSASTEQVASSVHETSLQSKVTLGKTQEVSASTEEQLASMEEVLASAEALSTTAAKLQEELGRYKL
ncbi:methyl-accepting chemotaxis protein [Paenibacillus cellulosilyticus]|uniref:Methyl-accepting chemotaxis protein n=1 Tax=Paenibacillus cellulosilyticus TaxID=375489 RepID=A0A2V2Z158_9BACL|nr:methyl-accepting chemotaxis protein [Paenibacillus cellulosilyticus]PWW08587.1 methyl-accepting chemotaxis protein [Paenibacillus cellulosilyticus]QKS48157.1 methyl-accepting chemotaxis protein [Paenibacillus cellulosilyticus]